jgi:hypothetical protein
LVRYERLLSGQSQPISRDEWHFVDTFRNRIYNLSYLGLTTKHEIAYAKYIRLKKQQEENATRDLDSEKNLREHYARQVDSSEHTSNTFISGLVGWRVDNGSMREWDFD